MLPKYPDLLPMHIVITITQMEMEMEEFIRINIQVTGNYYPMLQYVRKKELLTKRSSQTFLSAI